MLRIHAAANAILMGLSLLCASSVSAETTDRTGPQTQIQPILPPEWLPDLVVASATATTVCTAQGTVKARITVVVKNQSAKGTADMSLIPMQTIVDIRTWYPASGNEWLVKWPVVTIKPSAGGPKVLKPGQTAKATLEIAGIPKYKTKKGNTVPGVYIFAVRVDPVNGVKEANEKNNEILIKASDPCFTP